MMVLKTLDFLTRKDVMELTGYKDSKAGEIIIRLNSELEKKGYITFPSRVLASYFAKRVGEGAIE